MISTIRFKNPLHTLVIQTNDDVLLYKFNHLIKLMSHGWWYTFYKQSSINYSIYEKLYMKFKFPSRNTKNVTRKKKYLPRKSFPRTTKTIILRKLNKMELDPQNILHLHSLKVLNLSNNQISFLPKELGTLPHLEKFFLSHNYLGNTLDIDKWEWMEQTAISQSLKELDISNNNLTELPLQVGKLQSLLFLNISYNSLRKVPQIIGTLQQLAWLDMSKNCLTYLPGSMRGMELCHLCAAHNPFKDFEDLSANEHRSLTPIVVSLVDQAAKTIKKYRISYNNLPSILARYLDNSKYCCICRKPCFHFDIKSFELLLDRPFCHLSVKRISTVCRTPRNSQILFKCYFCSSKCYVYYCTTYQVKIYEQYVL